MEDESAAEPTREQVEGKRSRGEAPAVDLAAAQAHAQWWSPDLKPKLEVIPSDVAEGVDGATSAWVADECNRALGQKLPKEGKEMRAELAQEGKRRELEAWGKFEAFVPLDASKVQKQLIDTRWV